MASEHGTDHDAYPIYEQYEDLEEYEHGRVSVRSESHESVHETSAEEGVVDELLRQYSDSENISTFIPPFSDSSGIQSTFPPASWPTTPSPSDEYIQSSGAVVDDTILFADFDVESSILEIPMTKKPVKSKSLTIIKRLSKTKQDGPPPIQIPKKSKCVRIPFLSEILDTILEDKPSGDNSYVEYLKVSVDKFKILESDPPEPRTTLYLPEEGIAGTFSLNIEMLIEGSIVEVNCAFTDDSFTNGCHIFSRLTHDFDVIEERKTEFHHNDLEQQERILHVFMDHTNYIAYRTAKTESDEKRYRGCIRLANSQDFVLDSRMFILMRLMVAGQFSGSFQCYSVTMSGQVCRAVFTVEAPQLFLVNDKRNARLVQVRKSVYEYGTRRKFEMSQSYYLHNGELIYHTWKYSPYIVHKDIYDLRPNKLEPCMELYWKKDCIMNSLFEFKKEDVSHLLAVYLENYPEILEILNDYVICLFQDKPKSVIPYTCAFFDHI